MDSLSLSINEDESVNESDEESMTPAALLQKIEELWVTEKMSPTLEPHHGEHIDMMLEQLNHMSENLKRCKKNDFRLPIHRLEIDRIRYVVSSYLRIRLQKIETLVHYLLDAEAKRDESKPPLMSPKELEYARKYASNLENHMNSLGTKNMPENIGSLDKALKSVKPNLDSYVFFKVKKPVSGLIVEDNATEGRDEEVDLAVGEQHLMRYTTISHLMEDESVTLI